MADSINVNCLLILNNGVILLGADNGGLFRSENDGESWSNSADGLPNEDVYALVVNSRNELFAGTIDRENNVFLGGIYRSQNSGNSWEPVSSGLPQTGITSLAVNSNEVLFAGAINNGVYRSTNNGELWTPFNSGLTNQKIWSLFIDQQGYLYAGAFGGVFRSINSTLQTSYTINVKPDTSAALGRDLNIAVAIPEDFQPTIRRLYYRHGGERNWRYIDLETSEGDSLNFSIPQDSVSYRGIEYYIYLSDGATVVTYPELNPDTNPASIRVAVQRQQAPLQLSPLKYKMISVPLYLEDPSILGVLGDDYGEYDIKQWRVFRYQTHEDSTGFFEFPAIDSMLTPGNSFWLVTRSGATFDVENGFSISSAQPLTTTLQPGWNQVANPFAFAVSVDTIANTELLEMPVYYDGTQYLYEQTIMYPWEGYFVYNTSQEPVAISIPPVEAVVETPLGKPKTKFELAGENGYGLQLSAQMRDTKLIDTENFLGFSRQAVDGRDKMDFLEAPPIGEYLRVSIVENWERFAANYKSIPESGHHWEIEISMDKIIEKPVDFRIIES
ncbi:MAG: hypothetical protein SCK70_14660, partial [bacterium]|nr:hypothetical protein [bacterium]